MIYTGVLAPRTFVLLIWINEHTNLHYVFMHVRSDGRLRSADHATRSRIRAYEECPESSSTGRRDICPDGQKRTRQEKSDHANRANKGGPKSSRASRATVPSSEGSRELIGASAGSFDPTARWLAFAARTVQKHFAGR